MSLDDAVKRLVTESVAECMDERLPGLVKSYVRTNRIGELWKEEEDKVLIWLLSQFIRTAAAMLGRNVNGIIARIKELISKVRVED